jgi:hypothetical protein
MKSNQTLSFALSPDQQAVLDEVSGAQDTGLTPKGSFRAWNAAFVPCEEPLEMSYRAWNAAFVACDAPLES